jgi:ATP-dependent RNA helicase SUPV3L1/SUV3
MLRSVLASGSVVAKLTAGAHPLSPIVELLADDLLKGELREMVQSRLETWVTDHIARLLEPVVALRNAAEARSSDRPGWRRATRMARDHLLPHSP